MKKQILLCSILFSCFFAAQAQIQKGDVLIGGTFGYNSNSNGNENSNVYIDPAVGYAVGKNSVMSLKGGYSFSKNKGDIYSSNSNGYNVGLSWKKFFSIKERVGWFTDVYGLYTYQKSKTEYQTGITSSTSKGFEVGAKPGIYFLPTSSLLLTADVGGISYSQSKYESTVGNDGKSKNFNVNLLNSFTLGIHFIINKGRSEG